MTIIDLTTTIKATKQIVFDVSRDISIHQQSASKTSEVAIAGVTSGLINFNETVTWRGKHFGFYLTHKSRMTAMNLYDYFVDEMEEGKFKRFKHEHFFEEENGLILMKDHLQYETPYGIFGKVFDVLFLKKHLTQFLLERNKVLKEVAENRHYVNMTINHQKMGTLSTQKAV
jgi:ligand-binding SRPBCC domain-containing protein